MENTECLETYLWLIKIITSCKKHIHLKVSKKLINNFMNLYKNELLYNKLLLILKYKKQNINLKFT